MNFDFKVYIIDINAFKMGKVLCLIVNDGSLSFPLKEFIFRSSIKFTMQCHQPRAQKDPRALPQHCARPGNCSASNTSCSKSSPQMTWLPPRNTQKIEKRLFPVLGLITNLILLLRVACQKVINSAYLGANHILNQLRAHCDQVQIKHNSEHKQILSEFCNEDTCCNNISKARQPIANQREQSVQIVGLCVFELPPCKGKLKMHANDLQLPN